MTDKTQRQHPRLFIDVHGLSEDEIVAMVMGYVDAAKEQEARWDAEDRAVSSRAENDQD